MTGKQKILHWAPRILCILAILFVSLFALDAFEPDKPMGEQLLDFLMHMVPSFVLLLILLIAWKRELLGGILFMLLGVGLSPFIFMHNYRMNGSVLMSLLVILLITVPFIITGFLFVWNDRVKRKARKAIDDS
jgi:cytochrome bd-type quinol oxidase subunit 2